MRRRQAYAFKAAIEAIPTEPKFYDDMSDSDLKSAYKMVIGKKPHGKMKRETILERLHDSCDDCA